MRKVEILTWHFVCRTDILKIIHRFALLCVARVTGKPYHNALVWNDTRTTDICDALAAEGGSDRFRASTGLPLSPYFSGSKMMYLLDKVGGVDG